MPAADPSGGSSSTSSSNSNLAVINIETSKFPFCLVWTPIPVITWFFPMIGHLGIALSTGVIRDFAAPYFVAEDNLAFGKPARYLQLDPQRVRNGRAAEWDDCVTKASVVYGTRMHNLFCDNCHSHVGMALRLMHYDNSTRYNMVLLACWMFVCGKYVGVWGFVRTWLPFLVVMFTCLVVAMFL